MPTKKFRLALVQYFLSEDCKDKQRKYEEVPYLLEHEEQWQQLCTFITNVENFLALSERGHKFDLYRYWRSVTNASYSPDQVLIKTITESQMSTKEKMDTWSRAGSFFARNGAV